MEPSILTHSLKCEVSIFDMIRPEIIAGLRNSLDRGVNLEKAISSFINAGYSERDVIDSAKMIQTEHLIETREQQIQQEAEIPVKKPKSSFFDLQRKQTLQQNIPQLETQEIFRMLRPIDFAQKKTGFFSRLFSSHAKQKEISKLKQKISETEAEPPRYLKQPINKFSGESVNEDEIERLSKKLSAVARPELSIFQKSRKRNRNLTLILWIILLLLLLGSLILALLYEDQVVSLLEKYFP